MKICTLIMIMLLAMSGCTTTYKGSIKGSSNQEESKNSKDIVANPAENPQKP